MPISAPSATGTAARSAVLAGWVLACLLVIPFCLNAVGETDLGWHLAIGRIIAATGSIPRANLLTWTAPAYPWYATSWLYDVLVFECATHGGVLALQLLTAVLVALALLGMAFACGELDRQGGWLVPGTAMLLIPRITERPHMASWVVEAGVMALCVFALRKGWRWRAACLLPIALGSNFHAGVVFSSGILACFCLTAIHDRRSALREAAIGIGGFVALLANPGGPFIVGYNLDHLQVYDQMHLEEFQRPSIAEVPAFFIVLGLTLLAAVGQRRQRPAFLLVAAIEGAFGLFAVRLAFEFFLVAAPILAGALPALRERGGTRSVGLGFLLLGTLSLATNVSRAAKLSPRSDWDERRLPVRAARFIREEHLDGPHFNAFGDGGYLEWALPDLKAFQDARVQAFPPELFAAELKASAAPSDFQAWLKSLGVEWALTAAATSGASGNDLLRGPDWALIYWDDANELYMRRDVPRWRALVERAGFRSLLPTSEPDELVRLARELGGDDERRLLAEADRLDRARPGDAVAALVRCAALARLGQAGAKSACDRARAATAAADWQALVRLAEAPL